MLKAWMESKNIGWERLWNEFWNIFKFGVVGASSLLLNNGIFHFLSDKVWRQGNLTLIAIIAVLLASVYNFTFHRAWTFQAKDFNPKMLLRYFVVMVGGTGLHGGLFFVGYELLKLNKYLALNGAAFIVAFATYTAHRFFTFKSSPS